MNAILVATGSGCRVFSATGEGPTELAGRLVSALAPDIGGACLAVGDKEEIWRRGGNGAWFKVATTGIWLQAIASVGGTREDFPDSLFRFCCKSFASRLCRPAIICPQ